MTLLTIMLSLIGLVLVVYVLLFLVTWFGAASMFWKVYRDMMKDYSKK